MSDPSTVNLCDPGAGQVPELPCFRDNVTVLVTVGGEKAKFYPHKQLLCDGSHFFRTALTGGYKETTEAAIALPEDDPVAFECLLQFLYSGSYQVPSKAKFPNHYTFKSYNEQLLEQTTVYILAEKTQIHQLVKQVVDNLYEQRRKMMATKLLPSSDCIAWAYENTPSSSKLRRFLVDTFVWHSAPLPQETLAIDADFAAEVAVGLQNRVFDRSMRDPFKGAGLQSAFGLEASSFTTSDYRLRDSNGSHARGGLFLDGAIDPQVLHQHRPFHTTNHKIYGPGYESLQRPPIHPFGSAGGVYGSLIAHLPLAGPKVLHRPTSHGIGSPFGLTATQQRQSNN